MDVFSICLVVWNIISSILHLVHFYRNASGQLVVSVTEPLPAAVGNAVNAIGAVAAQPSALIQCSCGTAQSSPSAQASSQIPEKASASS